MTLELKAEALTAFRVIIDSNEGFHEQLQSQMEQSPGLFKNAPIVLQPSQELDITALIKSCRELGLNPVQVRTENELQIQQAAAHNIRVTNTVATKTPIRSEKQSIPEELDYHFVSKPVRSGQQVYIKGKHLVILKSVGAGAEVISDGDIHVYGALRGRAMAGVSGRVNSRIISQDMKPELIAIAGNYIVSEDMPELNGAAQAYLVNESIQFEKL